MSSTDSLVADILYLLERCSSSEVLAVIEQLRQKFPGELARINDYRGQHPLEVKWQISSDVIMDAIARSPDLTKRGVRGIIAEAVFERSVLPSVPDWESIEITPEESCDFYLRRRSEPHDTARVQVKLQRRERHEPKLPSKRLLSTLANSPPTMFVVEVQKTRSGTSKDGEKTRPYRFGDFDILAVNMHPSTEDWSVFRYTLGAWLLPRKEDPSMIMIMQPVAELPDKYWTDSLVECLGWFEEGSSKTLYQK